MPEAPLTPDKRTIALDPDRIEAPPPAPFVELGVVSCFSFLRGASDAVDLAMTARALGYDALGIADANSFAGVVRLHTEAKTLKLRPLIGTRIETVEGLHFLAYPTTRAAYGCLSRLISQGRMQTLGGEWQEKGVCEISLSMLAEHTQGVQLIVLPPDDLAAEFMIEVESNVVPLRREDGAARMVSLTASFSDLLPHLTRQLPSMRHLAASYLYRGDDVARIDRLDRLASENSLTLLATNDVHYHAPSRRPLQDVMTAIANKTTVAQAGHLLHANAERHLKSPESKWCACLNAGRMRSAPRARWRTIASFSLDELAL